MWKLEAQRLSTTAMDRKLGSHVDRRQRRPHEALGTTFGFSISAQNVDEFLKD
jgi:hypothetical protein